jgi:hypothetical protein
MSESRWEQRGLRKQLQKERTEHIETALKLADAMVRYLKAEDALDLMQTDLMQYGDHQPDCDVHANEYLAPQHYMACDCGWAEVEQERHYAAAPGGELTAKEEANALLDADGIDHFNPEEQGEY